MFSFWEHKRTHFCLKRWDSLVESWEKGKGRLVSLPNYQQSNLSQQHYYIILENNSSSPISPIYICCTLRSWVHENVSHYRTVSPRLGDNCASKCCSDNFPHTKYMSPCVENSQNHTLMIRCSPIAGRRFEKLGKLWDRFVP